MIAAGLIGATGMVTAAAPDGVSFLPDGYLTLIDVVLPAPIPQEPRGVADREIFKLTRALKGTARWNMAVSDVPSDAASLMRGFACATRINMTPANAPKTVGLLEKASRDAGRQVIQLKSFYKKKRPFMLDAGESCEPQTDELSISYDYPSGHAAKGWIWGLILAEVVDDRAGPILARARAYGESRVVCGVHNASAIEAGRMVAASTMAVIHTEPPYRDAVLASRGVLAALGQIGTPPGGPRCAAEEGGG
ncbi:MAG: phosphatase PAP2 family protein, partial [Rhizorhabdus sp.]